MALDPSNSSNLEQLALKGLTDCIADYDGIDRKSSVMMTPLYKSTID